MQRIEGVIFKLFKKMGKKKTITVTLDCKTPAVEFSAKAIPEGSILLNMKVRRGGNGKKTRLGKTLINSNAFQSSSITLKDKNGNSILDALPLEFVEHASFNGNGTGIDINRSDIDWNTSIIDFNDEYPVVAAEVIEIVFEIEQ